jgi:hypothetical protein
LNDWPEIVARQAASGLSVPKFCKAEGLAAPSFYAARKKLADASSDEPCPLIRTIETEYRPRAFGGETLKLLPFQKRILREMFRRKPDGRFQYQTAVYSCPKKSGKTELAAAVTYAFGRVFGGEIYSISNDLEGAKNRMFSRVVEALKMLREHDPITFLKVMPDDKRMRERISLSGIVEFAEANQVNYGPHVLRYIASDYAGEAGAMNALVVFDEIWAVASERGERLWTEMQPIPNLEASIRFVTTYAGFYGESALLWRMYESVVKPDPHSGEEHGTKVIGLEDLPVYVSDDGSMIVYWDHEARMPWHTPEFIEGARSDPSVQGRESEFRRLWQNEWSSGVEGFIEMEYVDRAIARGKGRQLINSLDPAILGV